MQRVLSYRMRQRYLASTWDEIVDRIVDGPIVQKHTVHPASPSFQQDVRALLHNQTFVPAGNTLAFGAHHAFHTALQLQPNCSVFDSVSVEGATYLWDRGIGVGTTVLHPDDNPVKRLEELQAAWNGLKAQHRPMRGNMFVYPANGKYVHNFIDAKSTLEKADAMPGFNISLAVNSYEALPDDVLDRVAQAAWTTGDPGIVFIDRVNYNVPLRHGTRRIQTLVPCGEQGMFDGEFCTLGSINLNSPDLLTTPAASASAEICLQRLAHAVKTAVTFLDNAVDACAEPRSRKYRRIGLGVMGWADYLARRAIPYESVEARRLATTLSTVFGAAARHQSMVLAHERGAFPYLDKEPFLPNPALAEQDASAGFPRHTWEMRNVSVTCLAPTGGITLVTKNRGFSIEPFFNEATKVSAAGHIAMASAWQTGMCNSVSKTVNLPESATVHDVRDAIKLAYQLRNIKALSVYRTGSRSAQPIDT